MVDANTQRDELVERLFSATLGMAEVLTVYLGDTLGLYRAIERAGSMTAPELANETGIFERYAREWLEQQAAAGILSVDDASAPADARRYLLPPGHIEPLLDPDSPYSIAPFCKSFVAVSGAMPDLVSAFRSGGAGRLELVRPRHGRGTRRLQPAVARRFVRHRVPPVDPRYP